jgi:hypothetical protein
MFWVHHPFISTLDRPQVAEGRCGYAGSNKTVSVDSVGKEQLLEPLALFDAAASRTSFVAMLLDANPLEDIHHTQRIRAVVANGRYFDRVSLDGLLEEAKARVAPQ